MVSEQGLKSMESVSLFTNIIWQRTVILLKHTVLHSDRGPKKKAFAAMLVRG
jgi:hypothetical protein